MTINYIDNYIFDKIKYNVTNINDNAGKVYTATVGLIAAGVVNNEQSNPNGLLNQITASTSQPNLALDQAIVSTAITIVNSVANGASAGAATARAILT
jgi:hypothetical protein